MLSRLHTDDLFVLCGDFNQPAIAWSRTITGSTSGVGNLIHYSPNVSSPANFPFTDGLGLCNLLQLSGSVNPQGRQLDLVLANETAASCSSIVTAATALLLFCYPALECSVGLPHGSSAGSLPARPDHSSAVSTPRFNFRRTDLSRLCSLLSDVDWSRLETYTSIDAAVSMFTSSLISAFPLCCPILRPAPSPPWSDRTLRSLKRDKISFFRAYRRCRSEFNLRLFKYAASAYRSYNRARFRSYSSLLVSRFTSHPASFWKFVGSRRRSNSIPRTMSLGDSSGSSSSEICALFASYFASVFDDTAVPSGPFSGLRYTPVGALECVSVPVDVAAVGAALRNLAPSVSPGPDGIPASVLVGCSEVLAGPLSVLFSLSLRTRTFPSLWKSCWVVPIFKKGSRAVVSNYRGISLLCACAKVFELVVHRHLARCSRQYISDHQHGFFPKRSTSSNLMCFVSFLFGHLDAKRQVDAVYTDFKSAFDRIPHSLLLAKLGRLGLADGLVDWFGSYLCDRVLRVKLGCSFSNPFCNASGVPQGSILGPLLFLLFLNDVCSILPPLGHLLFADDLKIFLPISSPADCYSLQSFLDSFSVWCTANGLCLCLDKCNIISFSRSSNPILYNYFLCSVPVTRVSLIKDLGVYLDAGLSFGNQISHVCSTAYRTLGLIRHLGLRYSNLACLKSLYCCLIRASLEYACVVWSPSASSSIARLEGVQRAFTRYALFQLFGWTRSSSPPLPPYPARCRLLGLESLESRRTVHRTTFIAKLLLGDIDAPLILAGVNLYIPFRPLRPRNLLSIERRRTAFGRNDPFLLSCSSFNASSYLFDFHSPVSSFVSRLRVEQQFSSSV